MLAKAMSLLMMFLLVLVIGSVMVSADDAPACPVGTKYDDVLKSCRSLLELQG
uniref:U-scutigerotoxin(01)-Tl1a n=1 Tax=Thereuopoda longicornis TaxID=353555 RepID=UX11A_THELO|nr:RecName: Full=U-scutigerotoxin(01)-Tl1a; Short=U-SCUTX(01)-Tl1a; Flags: Precursor [Thereuopoda longicornis]